MLQKFPHLRVDNKIRFVSRFATMYSQSSLHEILCNGTGKRKGKGRRTRHWRRIIENPRKKKKKKERTKKGGKKCPCLRLRRRLDVWRSWFF